MNTNHNSSTTTHIPSSPTSEKPIEPIIYSSATPDIVDAHNLNGSHHHNQRHRIVDDDGFSSPRPEDDSLEMARENQLMMGRQSPEGKDNMVVLPREQMSSSKSMDQYSTADGNNNGKINVQVTVLFGELYFRHAALRMLNKCICSLCRNIGRPEETPGPVAVYARGDHQRKWLTDALRGACCGDNERGRIDCDSDDDDHQHHQWL